MTAGRRSALVNWNTLDLLDGQRNYVAVGTSIEGYTTNYLQTQGIAPGENELIVTVGTEGDVVVESVTVFDDSPIEYSSAGPPKMSLRLKLPEAAPSVGDQFKLRFELADKGGSPAKGIVVRAVHGDGLKLLSEREQRYRDLSGLKTGELTFEAVEQGTHEIRILVTSVVGGQTSSAIAAIVGQPSPQTQSAPAVGWGNSETALGLILGIAGIALLIASLWMRRLDRVLPRENARNADR